MENRYNPDVLNCIANLGNDEVFTPPSLANQLLDLLPSGLFESPETKFLDPFTKSGVFLRKIVKRLDKGLESVIPDRQKRIDHIMHNQVYGIACTEFTSLLARRSVYCPKTASGKHSVTKFETPEGNILYKPLSHTWEGGKCIYCGASRLSPRYLSMIIPSRWFAGGVGLDDFFFRQHILCCQRTNKFSPFWVYSKWNKLNHIIINQQFFRIFC